MTVDLAVSHPYLLLAATHMSGILAYCLQKIGHGRFEGKIGSGWTLVILINILLIVVGRTGLLIATVWALFALSFWKVALVLFLSHLVWAVICWVALGHARVHGYEYAVYAISDPLILCMHLISAVTAALLLFGFWQGSPQ